MNYKKISTKRELEIAKDIEGKRHTGSGNKWHSKGDSSNETILVEDKFVVSEKYSVQLSIIDKLTKQAQAQSKIPILRFGFHVQGYDVNYACVESCYCNEMTSKQKVSSNKKSKTLGIEDLFSWFLNSDTDIALKLELSGREFNIIEWNTFTENRDKILA